MFTRGLRPLPFINKIMNDIWQINDHNGNQLGLLKVMVGLDIIDVSLRAKNKWGDTADWSNPIFIGTV